MRIRSLLTLTVTAAAAVLGASAPATAAAPTTTVILGICGTEFTGGAIPEEVSVPAGDVQLFVQGWGVTTRGHLVHWLKSQTTTLELDYSGEARDVVRDLTDAWSAPSRGEAGFWFSTLLQTITLAAGESVEVSSVTSWEKPTLELIEGRPGFSTSPISSPFTGRTCTITAT